MESLHRYFAINKPINMVSQFVSPDPVKLLGDLDFKFPEGTHAIGRLDGNSEGLLLLTTNKKVTRLLFSSSEKHPRVYFVQVNNVISQETLEQLRLGVSIPIESGEYYTTGPCEVNLIPDPVSIYPFIHETNIYGPHSWISIKLTEGKFRQVRKMIAAVRHRCKRLIRVSIEDISLDQLAPGQVLEMNEKDFFEKLHIPYLAPIYP